MFGSSGSSGVLISSSRALHVILPEASDLHTSCGGSSSGGGCCCCSVDVVCVSSFAVLESSTVAVGAESASASVVALSSTASPSTVSGASSFLFVLTLFSNPPKILRFGFALLSVVAAAACTSSADTNVGDATPSTRRASMRLIFAIVLY